MKANQTCRYLELESNGQRSEIRLHYWMAEAQNRTEVFPYNLADARWHRLALTLSTTQLVLYVDCSRSVRWWHCFYMACSLCLLSIL